MNNLRSFFLMSLMALLTLLTHGCGGNKNSAEAEAIKPELEQAMVAYLKQNSMGMTPTEIGAVTLDGEKADAIIKLKDAEGLYAMGVTWKVSFEKSNGTWKALRYTDKF